MIIKTKKFDKWARKSGLPDKSLFKAVEEMINGLVDANLGGGVYKKRVPFPGMGKSGSTRTLLATNRKDKWFFVFGFEKNERENINSQELEAIQLLANDLLSMKQEEIKQCILNGTFMEIKNENTDQQNS